MMTHLSRFGFVAFTLLLLSESLGAAEKASARGVLVEDLRNLQPRFHVRVAVDHADRIYKGGDEMKVTVQSEAAGYLYLFYLTAENKTWVLFPNFVQKDNAIPAGKLVQVPAPGARFRLRVGPPYGKEVLKALVSTKLLDVAGLRPEDLTKKDVTEIDPAKIGEILPVVKDAPAQWAEHAVEVTTVDPKTPPATKKERRVGLFVGVGKYLDPMTPRLPPCPLDAKRCANAMKERCGLDEAIILTDENATLANVEKAVRQTLAATTRPGDTVVFFWSGHGSRFPAGDGKIEHCLITYDTAPIHLEGKPTSDEIRAALDTLRRTSLTSDRLQRWLQELDGRRIFVVADACRAGGLHERGKSLDDPLLTGEQRDEPFLGDLLRRSKALDQKELALLAGCKADELSWVRNEGDLSVLTYFLIAELQAGDGALTLQQAYDRMMKPLTTYMAEKKKKVQTPVLINQMTPPFYLRPEKP